MKRLVLLSWLITYQVAGACPFDMASPLHNLRSFAELPIVRIDVQGQPTCTNTGTGFFINASGDVMTAGHVVPEHCEDAQIKIYWTSAETKVLSDSVTATVVHRSSRDVVVLHPDAEIQNRQYLRLEAFNGNAMSYRHRCVLLPSHYLGQYDALISFAEISSVALSDADRWALSGEGFNPTRSGSPIILDDGRVVAIFQGRPGSDDRANVIENRSYILPLHNLPKADVDLASLAKKAGNLKPFLSTEISQTAPSTSVASLGISITVQGFQTNPSLPTFLEKDGKLTQVGSLTEALLQAAISGSNVVRGVRQSRTFKAGAGYQFDLEVSPVAIVASSANPRTIPLPVSACPTAESSDCYVLSSDKRALTLNLTFYPGVDGKRSWLDGELRVGQRRLS